MAMLVITRWDLPRPRPHHDLRPGAAEHAEAPGRPLHWAWCDSHAGPPRRRATGRAGALGHGRCLGRGVQRMATRQTMPSTEWHTNEMILFALVGLISPISSRQRIPWKLRNSAGKTLQLYELGKFEVARHQMGPSVAWMVHPLGETCDILWPCTITPPMVSMCFSRPYRPFGFCLCGFVLVLWCGKRG